MFYSDYGLGLPTTQTAPQNSRLLALNADIGPNQKLITVKPGFVEAFKDGLALSRNSTAVDVFVYPFVVVIAFIFAIIFSIDGYQTTE